MKVLIVDDEKSLLDMYQVLFQSEGHEVRTSSNGLNAITDAVDYKPDVVLLDIMMPEMNGFGFLDALNNNTSLHPVVIVFSNIGEQIQINRALERGADAYLQKSDYSGVELLDAVNRVYVEALQKRAEG